MTSNNKQPVDVLAHFDAEIASSRALSADAFHAERVPKLEATRAAVAELIDAARVANAEFREATKYDHEDDEVGVRVCCNVVSYKDHAPGCVAVRLASAINNIGGAK